ncbi:hypothetical protein C0431_14945 [bacterium]|nr:hypothetical protein [bacterium]
MLSTICAAMVLMNPGSGEVLAPELSVLKKQMDEVAAGFRGRLGYHVIDLKTGRRFGFRDEERYPSASTIKTVVMIELFNQIEEGKMSFEDKLDVPPVGQRNPSMWTAHLIEGTKVNLDGLNSLMMNVSDNTATVMLSQHVGIQNIEKRMLGWGFENTACTIRTAGKGERLERLYQTFANMGVTSPVEMASILKLIHDGKAASPAACEKMIRIMSSQYWDDFIDWSVPSDVVIASKVGALQRSRSDSAIVYGPRPYILTVYTDNATDRSWGFDCEGHVAIRKLGGLAWNGMNPGRSYHPKEGAKKWAPTGGGVEDS